MNAKALAVCAFVSLINTVAMLTVYHAWNMGPRSDNVQRIAILDVAEIYRLKESQFAALIMKAGASEAERVRAIELARAFGVELSTLTQTLPIECGCLVLTKAAIVGGRNNVPDLTPEIKRRFGL